MQEIRRYDIGLTVFTPAPPSVDCLPDNHLPGKYYYGVGNKLFDYIDAGLNIMVNYTAFNTRLARKYRCHVDPAPFLYDPAEAFQASRVPADAAQVRAARALLDVKRHAPRLAKFYSTIQGNQRS
jgi:hypothetical protein